VLSRIVPIAEVGVYRTAAQVSLGFVVVQHFMFLSLPWQLRASGRDGLRDVLDRQRLLLALSTLAFAALFLLAPEVMRLFGERFVPAVWLFRALLAVRFAGLFWGPQHELLVSNGRIVADAFANIAILAVWPTVFLPLWLVLDPLPAAVIATALAEAAVPAVRLVLLRRFGIPVARGHRLGAVPPLAVTAAIVLGVWLAA